MAGIVEFVPIAQVGQTLLWLDSGEPAVQVAVRLLRLGEERDHLAQQRVELRVGMGRQAVAGCLDPLGDVGVPEQHRNVAPAHAALNDLWFPNAAQGVDAAGALALLVDVRDGPLAIDPLPWRPEHVVDRDLRMRQ